MRGMALPVNSIIIIAIALLVLVTVSAFFLTSAWQQSDEANAQRVFSTKCQQICTMGSVTTKEVTSNIASDQAFLDACQERGMQQGNSIEQKAVYCAMACNCDVESNLARNRQELLAVLESGSYQE